MGQMLPPFTLALSTFSSSGQKIKKQSQVGYFRKTKNNTKSK
jgi:hypothetical protein